MENAPIVRFAAVQPNPEVRERYDKWFNEVYYPYYIKLKGVAAIDRYRILKQSPDYPETISISYFVSLRAYMDYSKDPQRIAIQNDVRATWIDKYRGERIWDGLYGLLKSFGKSPLVALEDEKRLSAESTQVIHIEGLRLSAGDEDKYAKWLSTRGSEVYMTLFAKMAGLKRIDCLEYTGITAAMIAGRPKQDPDYPPYVSVFHFDSVKAYEEFVKSAELAAFREGIKVISAGGLDYKWNVQYQLVKSWRK